MCKNKKMQALNLPQYSFNIKKDENKFLILDEIRKKFVVLTPEEWVRQHIIKYLINQKHYPSGRIGVEVSLKVNKTSKRSDIVVFDKSGNPFLIVECKATDVEISSKVFEQIATYNIQFQAPYLFVSNGLEHYFCEIDIVNKSFRFIRDIPDYSTDTKF